MCWMQGGSFQNRRDESIGASRGRKATGARHNTRHVMTSDAGHDMTSHDSSSQPNYKQVS